MTAPAETARYFAFISYSHQHEAWAQCLHTALETCRAPRAQVGILRAVLVKIGAEGEDDSNAVRISRFQGRSMRGCNRRQQIVNERLAFKFIAAQGKELLELIDDQQGMSLTISPSKK